MKQSQALRYIPLSRMCDLKAYAQLLSLHLLRGVKILQEGIPAAIPVEMCYLGWQESLEKLTKLVEPEIPDA